MSTIYTGAVVSVPAYGFTAPADIDEVGDTYIIRFSGDPRDEKAFRNFGRPATHVLEANPPQLNFLTMEPFNNIYLRLDLGIVVVTKPYLTTTEHHRDNARDNAVKEAYGNVTQGG